MTRQLREYLALRGSGIEPADAATRAGIPAGEIPLVEKDIEAGLLVMPAPAPIGHNSGGKAMNVSAEELRLFIERIERLEEEKKGIADDIKDVYGEAKATGFDPKTMREIVRLRKMDKNARDERDALLETYMAALGMLADTPLGQAALERMAA